MTLDVLCVSRVESCCIRYLLDMRAMAARIGARFVLVADGNLAFDRAYLYQLVGNARVKSQGYIESVLENALKSCDADYVLRLDDDERASPAMERWLASGAWQEHDHWKFPRAHYWGDRVLLTPHLFPDHQTRLSTREKSGGRTSVHCGSPFGGGEEAPVAIEHYKFVAKSNEQRLHIAQVYDAFHPGYGTGDMKPFSLPEEAYAGRTVSFMPAWNGDMNHLPTERSEEQW